VWSVLSFIIFPKVVGKLCDREKSTPVILSGVGKASKVGFNLLVHMFALSICLGIECHADILIDASGFTHSFGEVPSESGVTIRDNTFGDSKQGEKMLEIKRSVMSLLALLPFMATCLITICF
jgi:hypothetical protein